VFDAVAIAAAALRWIFKGVNDCLEGFLCQCYLRFALIQIFQDLILSTAGIVFAELTNKGHGVTVRKTRE
jgi:hypothetical protein